MELAAGHQLDDVTLCNYLSQVGLCAREYLEREINTSLSGGEIKRIEIATVLARHSRVSVFDEPEAGIDLWSFSNLIEVFQEIRHNLHGSLVIITHQERILSIADQIIVIADGKVQSSGPREDILPRLLHGDAVCMNCPKEKEASL